MRKLTFLTEHIMINFTSKLALSGTQVSFNSYFADKVGWIFIRQRTALVALSRPTDNTK
jgi:hypothetical protein